MRFAICSRIRRWWHRAEPTAWPKSPHGLVPDTLVLPAAWHEGIEDTGERFLPNRQLSDLAFEHFHRYLLAARFAPKKKILDVACGEGFGVGILAQVGAEVVGIDNSTDAIASALRNYRKDNTSFVVGQAEALPFADTSFDLVTSFETIEHLAHPKSFLFEVRRVLRPSGVFVVSTPEREAYGATRAMN